MVAIFYFLVEHDGHPLDGKSEHNCSLVFFKDSLEGNKDSFASDGGV